MSEQLQSYFYVLWPKDRSSVAATSPTSPIYINTDGPKVGAAGEGSSSLAAIDTVLQPSSTSPPVYTVLGKHPAVVTGASSLPLVVGATEHSLTATSRAAGGCSSVVAVVSGTEESGSDSSDAVSSLTVSTQSIATTAAEAAQTVTITDSGIWAEIAISNLKKIVKTVSSLMDEEEDGPARKRIYVRDMAASSQVDCLECEIRQAEINILGKRVMALQAGATSSDLQSSQPQPGETVELVSGSGIYILAYRLEEARREAKTGTQLARKLMDCFWDKDTLAKSTPMPMSRYHYQQLDPRIIEAIEVYCLNYDNTLRAKDIHATMIDKCCQVRSRFKQ